MAKDGKPGSSKTPKQVVKLAVTAGKPARSGDQRATKRDKSVKRSGMDSRSPAERNDYLDSLLNPRAARGRSIGVPSGNLPSTKFQTKQAITVTVDPNGNASYCFMPALKSGGLKLGTNSTGQVTTMSVSTGVDLSGSGFTAAGYAAATAFDIVSATDSADILGSASAVRPVSMQVDFIPTGAALVEAGTVDVRLCGRGDVPGNPDTTNSGTSIGLWLGTGPAGISALVADDRCFEVRATESVSGYWAPMDEQDYVYRGVYIQTSGAQAQDSINLGETVGWKTAQVLSTTPATDTILTATTAGILAGITGAGSATETNTGYPYLQFIFRNLQATAGATTSVGTFSVYTNWEMVVDGTRVIDSNSPTMDNPFELTQAANVCALIPPVSVPTAPAAPPNIVRESAAVAATHLYDGAPKKAAIEGTSWLPSLIKKVGPMAGAAASMIPGIGLVAGPLVSAGSALIASLLE